jgi:hypothetical protein
MCKVVQILRFTCSEIDGSKERKKRLLLISTNEFERESCMVRA